MATVTVDEGSKTLGSPSSGDSLFILGGAQYINTNVDQSALANGLVAVEVSGAFAGQFGSAGSPFYSEVTGYIWYGAITGDMYYRGKDSGDATPIAYIAGGGHFHGVTDGTITTGHVTSGHATFEAPFIVVSLYVAGGSTSLLDDSSTDPTLIRMMAGKNGTGGALLTERGGTTITNECGDLTIDANTNTIGTLNCTGSTQTARTRLKECGTITTANLTGHIPDMTNFARPLTITNTTINMTLPGAQAFLDNPLITFTNTPARLGTDGR